MDLVIFSLTFSKNGNVSNLGIQSIAALHLERF